MTAAVVVLGGCDGGDRPQTDPTPILPSSGEPDPSPSASESAPEAPAMPAAARDRSFDGVEAFMDHWAATLTYALNTGDTAELERISSRGCQSCDGTRGVISEVYGEGGEIESDGWAVEELGFSRNRIARLPVARMSRGREVTRRPDAAPERFPASELTLTFELARENGEWIVSEFTPVE